MGFDVDVARKVYLRLRKHWKDVEKWSGVDIAEADHWAKLVVETCDNKTKEDWLAWMRHQLGDKG